MKAVFYIILHQYKNRIRRIFSKPLSAIITLFACFAFIGGPVMAFLMPRRGIGGTGTAEVIIAGIQLFIVFTLINAFLSQQSGLFTLADANFLFGAPLQPRVLLAYAMVQTGPASLMTALFMSFYYPFVLGNAMSALDFIASLLTMTLLFAGIYLAYYYIYIQDIAWPGLKKKIRMGFWIFALLLAAVFAVVFAMNGFDLSLAAEKIITGSWYNAIPVFGWAKWGVISAVNGNYLAGYLPSTLLLGGFAALFVFLMYRSEVDFYEQAQQDSIRVQEIMENARSGKMDARRFQNKKLQKASVRFRTGAGAILSRQMLEYKKSGSFLTFRELIVCGIYIGVGVIAKLDFSFVTGMMIFAALSFTNSDSWNIEFKKPYIYLIPDSSLKKVFYSILPGVVKQLLIGILGLTAGAFIFRVTVTEAISSLLLYSGFAVLFVFAGVFTYRLLGSQANAPAAMFLRMLLIMAAAVPSGVLIILAAVISGGMPDRLLTAVSSLAANLALSALLAFLSRELFEQSELMG